MLKTQIEAIDQVFSVRSNDPWHRLLYALWDSIDFDPDACASCDKGLSGSASCEGNIFSCQRMFDDECEVGRIAKEIRDTPNLLRRQSE